MDIDDNDEGGTPVVAKLSSHQRALLTQITQDIRTTVANLSLPKVSALSVLDGAAVDSLKDLYYMLNTEDPLRSMPIRRHVLSSNLPVDCLFRIAKKATTDPAAKRNRKRWSLPTYQTLRILSVLSLPVLHDNEVPAPAKLDFLLSDFRAKSASQHYTLSALVSLLQYYIDRKAEKRAAFAAAEEAKLEDARIDNILRFFGNLLSPPRAAVGESLHEYDREVHLSIVGTLVSVEFFSTLAVLFSSTEEATSHYTDLVFLVSEIYGLAFRHVSPRQMIHAHRNKQRQAEPAQKTGLKAHISRGSVGLREAVMRERMAVGGSRAATKAARWTTRYSGGVHSKFVETQIGSTQPLASASTASRSNVESKRIFSTNSAIQENRTFNPKHDFQEMTRINSEMLCYGTTKGRPKKAAPPSREKLIPVRQDLMDAGMNGLVELTSELIDVSFPYLVRELRDRIAETKERNQADESDVLTRAQVSFLSIVGSAVGFHREKTGKFIKPTEGIDKERAANPQIHQNCMDSILSTDFKVVKETWRAVEAGVEIDSFQLVFDTLIQVCGQVKESRQDDQKIRMVELATSAVLEMMKLLQGMAAKVASEIEEREEGKLGTLTPREVALNTIENLFVHEAFLNAPADLAKQYSPKVFSYKHLCNIVEITHSFVSILLDDEELSRVSVKKKTRNKTKAKKQEEAEAVANTEATEKEQPKSAEGEIEEASGSRPESAEVACGETNSAPEVDIGSAGQNTNNASKSVDHEGLDGASEKDKRPSLTELGTEAEKSPGSELREEMDKAHISEKRSFAFDSQSQENKEGGNPKTSLNASKDEDIGNGETAKTGDGNASGEKGSSNDNDSPREGDGEPKKLSIADMLRADADAASEVADAKVEATKVQKMLNADEKAAEEGQVEPEYVKELQPGQRMANANPDADSDGEEAEIREIESTGIVRRFAHTKAIETLLIPIRSAVCQTAELCDKALPIPNGANVVLTPIVVAKSVCAAWAIWRVARLRERGALCGQFFTYGIVQLLAISAEAPKIGDVYGKSVLGRLKELADDFSEVFFAWLKANPGLLYDMFFTMEKAACKSYASAAQHTRSRADGRPGTRMRQGTGDGGGSDLSEDEDVDDLDKIEILPVAVDGANDIGDKARRRRISRGGSRKKPAKNFNILFEKDTHLSSDDYSNADGDGDRDGMPSTLAERLASDVRSSRRITRREMMGVSGKRARKASRAGARANGVLMEDEDVDDVDNLVLGNPEESGSSDAEAGAIKERPNKIRKKKEKLPMHSANADESGLDSSDDEIIKNLVKARRSAESVQKGKEGPADEGIPKDVPVQRPPRRVRVVYEGSSSDDDVPIAPSSGKRAVAEGSEGDYATTSNISRAASSWKRRIVSDDEDDADDQPVEGAHAPKRVRRGDVVTSDSQDTVQVLNNDESSKPLDLEDKDVDVLDELDCGTK